MPSSNRPSSAHPAPYPKPAKRASVENRRPSQSKTHSELEYECKAFYLTVFDSITNDIETKDQLAEGVYAWDHNKIQWNL